MCLYFTQESRDETEVILVSLCQRMKLIGNKAKNSKYNFQKLSVVDSRFTHARPKTLVIFAGCAEDGKCTKNYNARTQPLHG